MLNEIADRNLGENARAVGAALVNGLEELASGFDIIGDIRGAGLYVGVDVVGADGRPDSVGALRIVNELRRRRVLISTAGKDGNVLKIRPPLVFSQDDAAILVERLESVIRNR